MTIHKCQDKSVTYPNPDLKSSLRRCQKVWMWFTVQLWSQQQLAALCSSLSLDTIYHHTCAQDENSRFWNAAHRYNEAILYESINPYCSIKLIGKFDSVCTVPVTISALDPRKLPIKKLNPDWLYLALGLHPGVKEREEVPSASHPHINDQSVFHQNIEISIFQCVVQTEIHGALCHEGWWVWAQVQKERDGRT